MQYSTKYYFSCILLLLLVACSNNENKVVKFDRSTIQIAPILSAKIKAYEFTDEWKKHWYDGNAEISTYHLKQSRYGEMHEGNITNIFVTEDFSKLKQVKLDDVSTASPDQLGVIKLNQSIKFITGIYPYSLMISVFSPVDIYNYPHAIKITATAQEWCGNSFYQLNNRNNRFLIEQRSYFEKEADQNVSLEPVLLEDECWNIIKIDPLKLPQGEHMMLPGALYLRLSHKEITPVRTKLTLVTNDSNYVYTLSFSSLQRVLNISIDKRFPYKIIGWTDSFPGTDGKTLTTTATLIKTMRINYWKKNKAIDKKLRADLGLPLEMQ